MAMTEREMQVFEKLASAIENLAGNQEAKSRDTRIQKRNTEPYPSATSRPVRQRQRQQNNNEMTQALKGLQGAVSMLAKANAMFIEGRMEEKYQDVQGRTMAQVTAHAEELYRAGTPMSNAELFRYAQVAKRENERIFDQRQVVREALGTGTTATRIADVFIPGTTQFMEQIRQSKENAFYDPRQAWMDTKTYLNRFINGGE